jgi:hypothetical protein
VGWGLGFRMILNTYELELEELELEELELEELDELDEQDELELEELELEELELEELHELDDLEELDEPIWGLYKYYNSYKLLLYTLLIRHLYILPNTPILN